jgi:hypothetical protein
LYSEDGKGGIDSYENLLKNIPKIIGTTYNEVLSQKVTEEEIIGVL